MSTLWTHFRRLVASLMLVAMASFVLHGHALSGMHQHGPGSTKCAPAGPTGHVHQAAVHHQSSSHAHQALHDDADVASHQHADTAEGGHPAADTTSSPCCASVCAIALTAMAPDALSLPMSIAVELLPASQNGSGLILDGLKRPPRIASIA